MPDAALAVPKPGQVYTLDWRALRRAAGGYKTKSDWQKLAAELARAMGVFEINTPRRAAMFIAQTGHESLGFVYREEIADGSAYEGRHDLGNRRPGDGRRFKGRGYIQITGRTNYMLVSQAFDVDFLKDPPLLASRRYAALSAAWWWWEHDCNELADSGSVELVTRTINGGLRGLIDRRSRYRRARLVGRGLVPKWRGR